MSLDKLQTIKQVTSFLAGTQAVAFGVASGKDERYAQVEQILRQLRYKQLKRTEKGIIMQLLKKLSGYSKAQLTRMIHQYVTQGYIKRRQKTANGFEAIYTDEDVKLLAQLDQRHDTPNGLMVKKLCERAHEVYTETGYERLAKISVSHLYNLRKGKQYAGSRRHFTKTQGKKQVAIGVRKKPRPEGKPGYIRIDTVHQGDLDGIKGVYHINAVDEVTQFEIVASVEAISENHLLPALELMLASFPFKLINFHSDNGSEYINQNVARLLNKLKVEMTKSRARTSNDNALAEGKNAAVVRKIFGHGHIPQRYAASINAFNVEALNPYINYHRPCLFPRTEVDEKGKQRKKYLYDDMMTPYDKLKSLSDATQYLKLGMTFQMLDDMANEMTDNQAADLLQKQRKALFKHIHEDAKLIA